MPLLSWTTFSWVYVSLSNYGKSFLESVVFLPFVLGSPLHFAVRYLNPNLFLFENLWLRLSLESCLFVGEPTACYPLETSSERASHLCSSHPDHRSTLNPCSSTRQTVLQPCEIFRVVPSTHGLSRELNPIFLVAERVLWNPEPA
jgi:hypothetical protein